MAHIEFNKYFTLNCIHLLCTVIHFYLNLSLYMQKLLSLLHKATPNFWTFTFRQKILQLIKQSYSNFWILKSQNNSIDRPSSESVSESEVKVKWNDAKDVLTKSNGKPSLLPEKFELASFPMRGEAPGMGRNFGIAAAGSVILPRSRNS